MNWLLGMVGYSSCGDSSRRPVKYLLPLQAGVCSRVSVCVSNAADLAAVTLFFSGLGRRMDLFQSLNLPHALTFTWWMCYFIKRTFTHVGMHIHTHTVHMCHMVHGLCVS